MSKKDTAEAELAVLLDSCFGRGLPRSPRAALRAIGLVRALPELHCATSGSLEGRMIERELRRSVGGVSTPLHQATTVLELPTEPGRYNVGHARATQRRKARKARRAGVTWRPVDDPAERRELLELADAYEKVNPREAYRSDSPSNADLLEIGLWLVAHHEGRPLLLSVTAVDGDWAILRYFRTLSVSGAASDARYLMTEVLAEQLVTRGVRYLCDTVSPFRLSPGLRHFGRMVGFRMFRVRFGGEATGATLSPAPDPRPVPRVARLRRARRDRPTRAA